VHRSSKRRDVNEELGLWNEGRNCECTCGILQPLQPKIFIFTRTRAARAAVRTTQSSITQWSSSRGPHLLTGETGAGKSILIDALSLLLGARASTDLLRTDQTRRSVGMFSLRVRSRQGA